MTYETLLSDTLKAIPEFQTEYNRNIAQDDIDEESGMHIVFGYVFTPLLETALKNNQKLAKDMFLFLEKMENSSDLRVQEVCEQSVLEAICGNYPIKKIWPIAGEKTKEGIKVISQYMDVKY